VLLTHLTTKNYKIAWPEEETIDELGERLSLVHLSEEEESAYTKESNNIALTDEERELTNQEEGSKKGYQSKLLVGQPRMSEVQANTPTQRNIVTELINTKSITPEPG